MASSVPASADPGGSAVSDPGQPPTDAAVDRVNGLSRTDLISELLQVCHSQRWAERVADAHPYADTTELLAVADRIWMALDPADWLEALRGHPRIGESGGSSQQFSTSEQAGMNDADAVVRDAIASGNRDYEDRFGHVFLISAQGRTPQDILANLDARLLNTASEEIHQAAGEHRRITQLRLQKLLT
ncbi:MAG: 2-oxo-4-hydroxy-4-carboxy-5-ureidoimidazoline decarboxylase [Nakamurella sp.]